MPTPTARADRAARGVATPTCRAMGATLSAVAFGAACSRLPQGLCGPVALRGWLAQGHPRDPQTPAAGRPQNNTTGLERLAHQPLQTPNVGWSTRCCSRSRRRSGGTVGVDKQQDCKAEGVERQIGQLGLQRRAVGVLKALGIHKQHKRQNRQEPKVDHYAGLQRRSAASRSTSPSGPDRTAQEVAAEAAAT